MLDFLKKTFTVNIPQKILAVCIAILIWGILLQSNQNSGLTVYDIQLVYHNLPENSVVLSGLLDVATVTLKVNATANNVTKENFKLVVNMSEMKPGDNIYYLSSEKLIGPKAEVVSIVPQAIEIQLDQMVMRRLPIKANIDKTNKIQSSNLSISPESIFVRGPRKILVELDAIYTSSISDKNIITGSILKTNIVLPKFVNTLEEKEVTVYFSNKSK